jgi:hypothetical protein
MTQQIYPVKCDLPCGMWKLLHGEHISLGLKKPKQPNEPQHCNTAALSPNLFLVPVL